MSAGLLWGQLILIIENDAAAVAEIEAAFVVPMPMSSPLIRRVAQYWPSGHFFPQRS